MKWGSILFQLDLPGGEGGWYLLPSSSLVEEVLGAEEEEGHWSDPGGASSDIITIRSKRKMSLKKEGLRPHSSSTRRDPSGSIPARHVLWGGWDRIARMIQLEQEIQTFRLDNGVKRGKSDRILDRGGGTRSVSIFVWIGL